MQTDIPTRENSPPPSPCPLLPLQELCPKPVNEDQQVCMKTGGTLQVWMLLYITAGNFVCFLGGCEILYTDNFFFFF